MRAAALSPRLSLFPLLLAPSTPHSLIPSPAPVRYNSLQRARVVKDRWTNRDRGYGFLSFGDPYDCIRAMREMDGASGADYVPALPLIPSVGRGERGRGIAGCGAHPYPSLGAGKFCGGRPIQVRKSTYKDRAVAQSDKKLKSQGNKKLYIKRKSKKHLF